MDTNMLEYMERNHDVHGTIFEATAIFDRLIHDTEKSGIPVELASEYSGLHKCEFPLTFVPVDRIENVVSVPRASNHDLLL
jgi:hypothetical protein